MKSKTELSLSQQEAHLGDYFLRGIDVPADLNRRVAGRLVGLLVQLDSDPEAARLAAEQSPLKPQDITDFWGNYQRHVANLSPDAHEIQLQKAVLFEHYNQVFKQSIEARDPEVFEAFVGEGAFSCMHKLELDGRLYAVREAGEEDTGEIDKHLEAAVRVADIPHMEHIVAASYIDSITVAPFIDGQLIGKCDAATVATAHVADLYAAMKQAEARGVGFDFAGNNLFYHPDGGFTAIDLGMKDDQDNLSAVGAMMTLVDVLAYDEKTVSVARAQALVGLIDKIVDVIRDDVSNRDLLWFIDDARRNLLDRAAGES